MGVQQEGQDVIVVGAGLAGLVSGVEAAGRGARVTILDKLGTMTGVQLAGAGMPANDTTRSGGGGLSHWSYRLPVEELLKAHLERGWQRVAPDLLRAYLEEVVEDCLWLRDELGMPFDGNRVRGRGLAICPFLYKVAEARAVTILFSTSALKLQINGARVAGVKARGPAGDVDLQARVVVLATGGFEGNREMMLKYLGPSMAEDTHLLGSPTNTGDGHLMAAELGAQMSNPDACHMGMTDIFQGKGPAHALANISRMGIFLNREGKRFVDESAVDVDTLCNAISHQPGRRAALVFDDKAMAESLREYEAYPNKDLVIFKAQRLEGLASSLEMPPDLLSKAVTEFNGALRDGWTIGTPIPRSSKAFPIDTPPYYAFYPVLPAISHPLGGLKINARAQVLDRDGQPVPGLYAAGALVNWAYGKAYDVGTVTTFKGSYSAGMSGGLTAALVFGRLAGRAAAEEASSR